MSPISQRRDPFAYGSNSRGTFSAWAVAIVFATVAVVSFAIDQALTLAPNSEESSAPSLLHPVQLIQSLTDAASD
jgi:glycogen debranching enzyme